MGATKKALDFTNVKDAGNFNPRRVPAGDYRATVTKVDDHVKGEGKDRKEMWVFTIVPTTAQRNSYPYYCGFGDNEAWKIRNLLIAAGFDVPKRRVGVDPNKLVGKEIGVALDDDEYEGKEKSVVQAVFPVEELSSDSPTSGRSKSSSKSNKNDDDGGADEDVSEEDLDAMDLEEI